MPSSAQNVDQTIHAFRMPGEFESQSAILLAWPHAKTDWADQLAPIRAEYIAILKTILSYQKVLLLVDPDDQDALPDELVTHNNLHVARIGFDDTWCRDFGAISLVNSDHLVLLNFQFTAWDKPYENQRDNQVNHALFTHPSFQQLIGDFESIDVDFVLEGGAIESNGRGTILVNWHCLRKRHPRLTDDELRQALKTHLCAKSVIGIDLAPHEGDDTDGHIDTMVRFIAPDTLVAQTPSAPKRQAMLEAQLDAIRLTIDQQDECKPHIIMLPRLAHDTRWPFNYANFVLINGACLMPSFGLETDAVAADVLAQALPDRTVHLVPSYYLMTQFGGPHCASMQFPMTHP